MPATPARRAHSHQPAPARAQIDGQATVLVPRRQTVASQRLRTSGFFAGMASTSPNPGTPPTILAMAAKVPGKCLHGLTPELGRACAMLGKVLHDLRDVRASAPALSCRDMLELMKHCMEWNNRYAVACDERKLKWLAHDSMHKDVTPRKTGPSPIPCRNLAPRFELFFDPSGNAALKHFLGPGLRAGLGFCETSHVLFCDWRDIANWPKASLHLNMACLQTAGARANAEQVNLRNAVFEAAHGKVAPSVEPFINKCFS